jgi:hypothetical protein|nr:MAG TPA: PROTEIN-plastocyanin oxido-reductase Cytochrome b6f Photosynthesis [Caudoviricetes sp.]
MKKQVFIIFLIGIICFVLTLFAFISKGLGFLLLILAIDYIFSIYTTFYIVTKTNLLEKYKNNK